MSPKNKKREKKVPRYTALEYNPDYIPVYSHGDVGIAEIVEAEHDKDNKKVDR